MKTKGASKVVEGIEESFAAIAGRVSHAAGSVWAFSGAAFIILVWAATGPIFGFSEVWQLVINTGTTIITFLMVFLIQHAQNKDMRAIQLKLNELIAAVEGASNRLIDVEDLSDREVERLYQRYQCLATTAKKLSQGAKLSVERARAESKSAADVAHADRKQPVPIKKEASGRKSAKH
jgi:low affinity Fe/Cu permease